MAGMHLPAGFGLGVTLALAIAVAAPGCTPVTFRPTMPRRSKSDGVRVELERADLRRFTLDVNTTSPTPLVVQGAWIAATNEPEGGPCARPLAALSVESLASVGSTATFRARFSRVLLDALAEQTNLEVRVVGKETSEAQCIALPLSGQGPSLHWTLEPWGRNRPFVGRSIDLWFPVESRRYSAGVEVMLLRLGRWWGPARFAASLGAGSTCCSHGDPNQMFTIPGALSAEVFPIVGNRFALGVSGGYQVRPSWFGNDNSRGFQLIHGPVGNVELGYLPVKLPGFAEGPGAGTIGLGVSVGRWLPDGGATVFLASLSMN